MMEPIPQSSQCNPFPFFIESTVFAKKGLTREEYYEHLERTIEIEPDIIIDDGGDLTALALKDKRTYKNIKGGNEETTTGVVRLKNMEKAGALVF